jgi:hypothetical protein
MADIINLGSSVIKHKLELEERNKIIGQQQQQIDSLKHQLASVSAVNDMLKLLLIDAINTQKQTLTNNQKTLTQLQDLLKKLPS